VTQVVLRDVCEADFARILELNDSVVEYTSPKSLERLRELVQLSCYCRVAEVDGEVAAFLLAMRDGVPYVNDNFGWFAERMSSFIYVDRIVVGAACAGLGIGSLLYRDLFSVARSQGVATVTCEYNIQPPNPGSQRFHDKFGFRELGQQWVADGTKRVSLQAAPTSQLT
jgi:predicted GNAT superfamily acetyltransferase